MHCRIPAYFLLTFLLYKTPRSPTVIRERMSDSCTKIVGIDTESMSLHSCAVGWSIFPPRATFARDMFHLVSGEAFVEISKCFEHAK